MGLVALDSNIFIRALDDAGTLGDKSRALLDDLKQNQQNICISVMVLEEFFVKVYKQKRVKDFESIFDFITLSGLAKLVDINQDIALLAAKIRAQKGIKAPDALHLASALVAGAKLFITTDKRIPQKVEDLKVTVLNS